MDDLEKTIIELKAELSDLHEKFSNLTLIHNLEKEAFRQADEKVRQSELKYRTIFENVQDVFYQTDLKGIIHEISPSIKYFSDFNAEELIGKPVYDIYKDPGDRSILLNELAQKGEVRDYVIRLKSGTGELKYVSINALLICDEKGMPSHINGSLRDITARKLAQEVIAKREEELNYAQLLAKMGSWKLDMITGLGIWSRNMFAMLDFPSEEKEITFSAFMDLVHPDDRTLIDEKMQVLQRSREGVKFEFRHVSATGEVKWFQNNIVSFWDGDQLVSLQGVNIDITENKNAELELIKAKEKAEASDRLKTAFMNNISHEIRTPLNAIQGFTPLIIDPSLSFEEKQEFVEIMNFSMQRLIQTITDYMDISLITSGNIEVVNKEISIVGLIHEIVDLYQIKCQQKQLKLNIDLSEVQGSLTFRSDKSLLHKILCHLLDNAVKFTKEGSINIWVKRKEQSLEFIVNDSGIGISEKAMTTIFSHFVQEDESNRRPYEGSGLGLAIVHGLVALLGGEIRCESQKGVGSTFQFTIPGVCEVVSADTLSCEVTITSVASKPVILIVEDDYSSYRLLEQLLKYHFQIYRAENGPEAIELYPNIPGLELVLMDIKLPGMDGYEVTRHIRKSNKDLIIIAQTAHGLQGEREKAINAGCNDYIPKPINLAELRNVINRYFNIS